MLCATAACVRESKETYRQDALNKLGIVSEQLPTYQHLQHKSSTKDCIVLMRDTTYEQKGAQGIEGSPDSRDASYI